jgi:hypothetical protein
LMMRHLRSSDSAAGMPLEDQTRSSASIARANFRIDSDEERSNPRAHLG